MLLLLLGACASCSPTTGESSTPCDIGADSGSGESGADETGDSGTADTAGDSPLPLEADFDQVGIGGVVRVTWTTPVPADGEVLFGQVAGALDRTYTVSTSDDGLHHEALVVGLAAGEEWFLQASSAGGGRRWVSDEAAVTPPAPPASLHPLVVDEGSDPTLPGLVLWTNADPNAGGVGLFDRRGRYVWWHRTEAGKLILEAGLSADGTAIEWLETQTTGDFPALLQREALDGSLLDWIPVPNGHHAFTTLPEGGWAVLEGDRRNWDGQDVVGDRIVEIDAAGQEVGEVWSVWDSFTPPDGYVSSSKEWSHANAIVYLPELDAYLVTLYIFRSIVLVDRATGALEWQLGGDGLVGQGTGDFAFPDGGFDNVHDAQMLDDGGILLFENGDFTADAPTSYAEEFAIDLEAWTATPRWVYDAGGAFFADSLGNADRLTNGDTFIAWGPEDTFTQIDPDGNVVWQAELPEGVSCGFSHVLEGLGGAAR
jgi:hypothetical protein